MAIKRYSTAPDETSDRAFLGILLEEEETGPTGVNVIGITPDSQAQDAGIKSGDIVTGTNGSSWLVWNSIRWTRSWEPILAVILVCSCYMFRRAKTCPSKVVT